MSPRTYAPRSPHSHRLGKRLVGEEARRRKTRAKQRGASEADFWREALAIAKARATDPDPDPAAGEVRAVKTIIVGLELMKRQARLVEAALKDLAKVVVSSEAREAIEAALAPVPVVVKTIIRDEEGALVRVVESRGTGAVDKVIVRDTHGRVMRIEEYDL